MTSLNFSIPEVVKDALQEIPTWEHPNAGAYIVSLLVKDLAARKLLKIQKP